MENTGDNEPPPEDAPPTHMSTSEEPPSKEPGTSIPTPPKPSPLAQSSSSSNSLHKELEELRKLGTVVSFGTKLRQRVKQKNSVNLADWNARLKKQKEEERRRQRESQEMLRRHHDHNAGMRQSTAQKTKTNRHSFESSGTRKWTGPAPVNARDCRDFKKDTLRDLFGAEGKKKFQDLRTRFITKKTESFGNVRVEVRRRKKNKGPLIKNNVDEKKVSGVVGVDGASESTDASEKKELLSPTITAAADAVEKADIEDSNTATTEEEDEFEYYEVGINDDGVEFEIETDEISSEEGPIEKLIMADEEKAVVLLEPAPKIRIPTPLTGKRLDPSVIPHHYDINYKMVDLIKFTFSGTVEIEIEAMENDAVEDRRSIILHSLGLDLTSASLGNDSTVLDCESFRFNIPRQTVDLLFPGSILPGFYKLSLSFSGILNDEMRGFYRSAYALNGEKRYMAVTKFEPTNARRAFPCFDEPIMKATYSLKVLVPSVDNWMLVAISNTPTSSIKTVSGGREYTFEKTPKMSSYLVALIVGEMDSIKVSGGGGVSTSVYVPPGRAEDGRFCLDVASKALLLYSKLYGVPYPLGKSDLIAVPDFASGAMENWGAVTYRDSNILLDSQTSSSTTKRSCARTVCHELAHQWFGNLVTMKWWTSLWLKEGFARYMEFVAVNKIFPGWKIWEDFVQSVMSLALDLDAMEFTHPVEVEVSDPDEINAIFDSISYAKGASIIRMIAAYLDEDIFWKGVRIYLTRHAYGNTSAQDLWNALSEAADDNLDVGAIMDGWTSQPGYPVLCLEQKEGEDAVNATLQRFHANGPCKGDAIEAEEAGWTVPLLAFVGKNGNGDGDRDGDGDEDSKKNPTIVKLGLLGGSVGTPISECPLLNFPSEGWFKLNAHQSSFIRVNYTAEQWRKLGKVIHEKNLPTVDILGLVNDVFALGKAGYVNMRVALDVAWQFRDDENNDYSVWKELSENLSYLASLYRTEPFYPKFQTFLRALYAKQMVRLDWEDNADEVEDVCKGSFRSAVIRILGIHGGDAEVRGEAFRRFKLYVDDRERNPLDGDLRGTIFKVAICQDEEEVFKSLKMMYSNITYPEERKDCLVAMASVLDSKRHADMIDFVLFSEKVRLQDIVFLVSHLSTVSDLGGKNCWSLMKDRFEALQEQYGSGPMWPALVASCVKGLRTLEEAQEVEAFFEDKKRSPGSGSSRLRQALETVRTKVGRVQRDRDDIRDFLDSISEAL